MRHLCGVWCVACPLLPLYLSVWLADKSLVSSILPCSSSPIDVDVRALCQAAGSLKKLKLLVDQSCTPKPLGKVFDHRPLEELDLRLFTGVEVSIACSPPGMYSKTYS